MTTGTYARQPFSSHRQGPARAVASYQSPQRRSAAPPVPVQTASIKKETGEDQRDFLPGKVGWASKAQAEAAAAKKSNNNKDTKTTTSTSTSGGEAKDVSTEEGTQSASVIDASSPSATPVVGHDSTTNNREEEISWEPHGPSDAANNSNDLDHQQDYPHSEEKRQSRWEHVDVDRIGSNRYYAPPSSRRGGDYYDDRRDDRRESSRYGFGGGGSSSSGRFGGSGSNRHDNYLDSRRVSGDYCDNGYSNFNNNNRYQRGIRDDYPSRNYSRDDHHYSNRDSDNYNWRDRGGGGGDNYNQTDRYGDNHNGSSVNTTIVSRYNLSSNSNNVTSNDASPSLSSRGSLQQQPREPQHRPPSQSEEDIILQSVREREAAEKRAKYQRIKEEQQQHHQSGSGCKQSITSDRGETNKASNGNKEVEEAPKQHKWADDDSSDEEGEDYVGNNEVVQQWNIPENNNSNNGAFPHYQHQQHGQLQYQERLHHQQQQYHHLRQQQHQQLRTQQPRQLYDPNQHQQIFQKKQQQQQHQLQKEFPPLGSNPAPVEKEESEMAATPTKNGNAAAATSNVSKIVHPPYATYTTPKSSSYDEADEEGLSDEEKERRRKKRAAEQQQKILEQVQAAREEKAKKIKECSSGSTASSKSPIVHIKRSDSCKSPSEESESDKKTKDKDNGPHPSLPQKSPAEDRKVEGDEEYKNVNANSEQKKCKYGSKCRTQNCRFRHPAEEQQSHSGKNGNSHPKHNDHAKTSQQGGESKAKDGDETASTNSTIAAGIRKKCKYGSDCRTKNCKFVHPSDNGANNKDNNLGRQHEKSSKEARKLPSNNIKKVEDEKEVNGDSTSTISKKCKYGAKCRTKNCQFRHPSDEIKIADGKKNERNKHDNERHQPSSSDKKKEEEQSNKEESSSSSKECRYGSACRTKNCRFRHPAGARSSAKSKTKQSRKEEVPVDPLSKIDPSCIVVPEDKEPKGNGNNSNMYAVLSEEDDSHVSDDDDYHTAVESTDHDNDHVTNFDVETPATKHSKDDGSASTGTDNKKKVDNVVGCTFFVKGSCKYGDKCRFSHEIVDNDSKNCDDQGETSVKESKAEDGKTTEKAKTGTDDSTKGKKCKYGSKCRTKNCQFRHPADENKPQDHSDHQEYQASLVKKKGEEDKRSKNDSTATRSDKECRYGSKCRTKNCPFKHPVTEIKIDTNDISREEKKRDIDENKNQLKKDDEKQHADDGTESQQALDIEKSTEKDKNRKPGATSIKCRYGSKCRTKNCPFKHPPSEKKTIDSSSGSGEEEHDNDGSTEPQPQPNKKAKDEQSKKDDDSNSRSGSVSAKDCRYGEACRTKNCRFRHPPAGEKPKGDNCDSIRQARSHEKKKPPHNKKKDIPPKKSKKEDESSPDVGQHESPPQTATTKDGADTNANASGMKRHNHHKKNERNSDPKKEQTDENVQKNNNKGANVRKHHEKKVPPKSNHHQPKASAESSVRKGKPRPPPRKQQGSTTTTSTATPKHHQKHNHRGHRPRKQQVSAETSNEK